MSRLDQILLRDDLERGYDSSAELGEMFSKQKWAHVQQIVRTLRYSCSAKISLCSSRKNIFELWLDQKKNIYRTSEITRYSFDAAIWLLDVTINFQIRWFLNMGILLKQWGLIPNWFNLDDLRVTPCQKMSENLYIVICFLYLDVRHCWEVPHDYLWVLRLTLDRLGSPLAVSCVSIPYPG